MVFGGRKKYRLFKRSMVIRHRRDETHDDSEPLLVSRSEIGFIADLLAR